MPPIWLLWFDLAIAVACAALLHRGRTALAETTLIAAFAWCWPVLAIFTAAQGVAIIGGAAEAWVSHLQYLAALATFAPPMAVLGAKRPQHHAWQLIVGSLLVILAWPSLAPLGTGRDGPLELHATWKIFLGALWIAGWPNYLPTRFRTSAILYGVGQALALAPILWPAATPFEAWSSYAGAGGLACFALAARFAAVAKSSRESPSSADAAWLDFRDAYGAVWGLRVLERFNAIAASLSWSMRLTWHGLESINEQVATIDDAPRRDASRQLEALLCRFVSPAWIARRATSA